MSGSPRGRYPLNRFKNNSFTFDVPFNHLPEGVRALGLLRQIAVKAETA